ncbi:hypothetical protein CBS101457_006384 [Exobasidium rhododendri]|nr:hypothetical protein CBS101457_006384 [Exobasidium rhododendri]
MSNKIVLPTIVTIIEKGEGDSHDQQVASGSAAGASAVSAHNHSDSIGGQLSRNTGLQLPGAPDANGVTSPSSPALSFTSELSSSDAGGPFFQTSLALRDNNPTKQLGHERQRSYASAHTDVTGELTLDTKKHHQIRESRSSVKTGSTLTAVASHNHLDRDSSTRITEGQGKHSIAPSKSEVQMEEKLSRWKQFRSNAKSRTRQGRREAQANELRNEEKKMRDMDPTPFRFKPVELGDLVDPKSVKRLREMGGVELLLASLGTDPLRGLSLDGGAGGKDVESVEGSQHRPGGWVSASAEDRKRVYGTNILPEKKSKSLLLLMWLALQDKILILLCFAAVISLALGLYTDFGAPPELIACELPPPGQTMCELPAVDWVEGVAILVAVAIVDIVGSLNDWQKERQFKVLNAKKEERDVKAIRQGAPMLLSVHHVQVGDILQLEPGEIIPCDGIFLRGHNIKCDESGATGESDMIRKVSYNECLEDLEKAEKMGTKPPNRDCFLISGSRCLEGMGEYCVVAVGPTSFNGKLLMSLRTDSEMTPLQAKLNRLAEIIAYAGSAAGVLLFAALMIRFFVQLANPKDGVQETPNQKAQNFIQILISAVVIIVVAVPEGLPLATTLALAFATKRMTKENLLVRMLSACETSANSNVICTDKTGTLTQNEMSVVAGSVGVSLKFAHHLDENQGRVEAKDVEVERDTGSRTWAIDQDQLSSVIDGPLRQLFNDAIAVNSTAFEESEAALEEEKIEATAVKSKAGGVVARLRSFAGGKTRSAKAAKYSSGGKNNFVGSKTETALLKMAKDLQWEDYRLARARNEVVTTFPFSSERKAMAIVVKKPEEEGGGYRMFAKGASEILSKLCSSYVDVHRRMPSEPVTATVFTPEARSDINKTIIFYANQTLRTIALCYKDFESWPPAQAAVDADGLVTYESLAQDMTLIAITGIEDPLRPGVRNAVATCGKAGIQVKMCTGDNVLTARSIATQCGIFSPGGIIMEGPVFRNLNELDMLSIVPRLQVLARCSPEDKKILVECLKKMDNVVAVTGDGTNDAPALKTANVGFSMGIAGTEVAREASDIILMDDNFESIVTAVMWGRAVGDSIRKFLQFQLSVNVGAVGITFISAVASDEEKSVFTAVQLLWINLIMDTLAALALATDPASRVLLDRKPDRRSAPLITTDMWKMIVGQSVYQFALILTLNFAGKSLLNLNATDAVGVIREDNLLRSLIFNLYVFCQLFNQINCRSLSRDLNFFSGLHRNFWFIGILAVEVAFQILIAYKGGAAFSVVTMGGREWAITIIGGLISWPIGCLIRLAPTQPIENLLIRMGWMPDPNAIPTHKVDSALFAEELKSKWQEPAIGEVAEDLSTFAKVRGGRSRVAFLGKSRLRKFADAGVHPSALGALVPALIGAGVGGDWRPTNPPQASRLDPAAGNPSLSSWQLYQGGQIQMHPETAEGDDCLQMLQNGTKTY